MAHLGVQSDEALAATLGVGKSTVATWRRRGSVPRKAVVEIERRYGIELSSLDQRGSSELRDYLLRYALYYIVVSCSRLLIEDGADEAEDPALADDFAIMDPYLKRAINRAASATQYQGVHGAAEFLSHLRAGRVQLSDILAEARQERDERFVSSPDTAGRDTLTEALTNRL